MDSTKLMTVSERLNDINRLLTEAILETDIEHKNMILAMAKRDTILLNKDILDHAAQDILKEMDV